LQLVDVFKESRVLDWDREKVSEVFPTLGTLIWATSLGLLACLVEAAFAVCLQYFADVCLVKDWHTIGGTVNFNKLELIFTRLLFRDCFE